MSRVEENSKLVIPSAFPANKDSASVRLEICKLRYLEDISKSLAVIADGESDESDCYMHDMGLINYILNRYMVTDTNGVRVDIEEIYRGWRKQNGK